MPKLRDLRRYLKRNGWELYKSTDHDYYRKWFGENFRFTKVSFGDGEIEIATWRKIKKQMGITDAEFSAGLK